MADQRWHEIAQKIKAADPAQTLGEKLCSVGVEVLAAHTVSLALVIDHAYSAIASSDSLATLLDEEQFALGDGPTFDAQRSEAPVIVEDIQAARIVHKWPAFTPKAARHNVRGILAFPLRIGNAYLGVMTAYRSTAGEPTAEQYADGLILASLATAELVRRQAGVSTPELADVFEPGLYDQSALQLAAGMTAEALNCSIVEALVRIRANAFAKDLPLSEIAKQIVARELVLKK